MYAFLYFNMSNVTAGYGSLFDSIAFSGNIHILIHVLNVNFVILLQIVCLLRQKAIDENKAFEKAFMITSV